MWSAVDQAEGIKRGFCYTIQSERADFLIATDQKLLELFHPLSLSLCVSLVLFDPSASPRFAFYLNIFTCTRLRVYSFISLAWHHLPAGRAACEHF